MTASIADIANIPAASKLNITSPTLLKTGQGVVLALCVLSGTAPGGTINDCSGSGAAATANQIAAIPSGAGVLAAPNVALDLFYFTGLVVVPPPGGAVSVHYG